MSEFRLPPPGPRDPEKATQNSVAQRRNEYTSRTYFWKKRLEQSPEWIRPFLNAARTQRLAGVV